MLTVRNLSYIYDNKAVLKDISLTFDPAKTYVITGREDNGMDFLLKILGRITKPSNGEVLLNNRRSSYGEVYSPERIKESRQDKIGFVFKEGVLLANLSVYDNLFLPVRHLYPKYNREEITRKIIRLFKSFNLETKILGARPSDISFSARKLIDFIRAIIIDPDIFLVNKPLFNLDYADGKNVADYLLKIKEKGRTLIISTNNGKLMKMIADEVIIMERGMVLASVSSERFFNTGEPLINDYIKDTLGF